jgi:hypothetical protein
VTNPGTLIDATVEVMRSISQLVTDELGGDESLIFPYKDGYPRETSLQTAVQNAGKPSILVAYGGLAPGRLEENEVDKHKILAFFRSKEYATADYGYFNMLQKLVDGLTFTGLPFRTSTIHENCYPPEKITFRRIVSAPDDLDFWELSFLLTEITG